MAQEDAPDTNSVTAANAAPKPRAIRNGDRIRSLVDDVFVAAGQIGTVINVAAARDGAPPLARIDWDNQTSSLAYVTTLERVVRPDNNNLAGPSSSESA